MAETNFWKDFFMIVLSYVGVLVLAYVILAWMMAGALQPYLKVKTSRGKKILVKVRTITQDYFKPGIIDKGFLVFTDREKDVRRLKVPNDKVVIYRSMGVNNINIDDETNSIQAIDYSAVSGYDAVKYSELYTRALYKPALLSKNEQIILVIVIVILIIAGVNVFMTVGLQGQIKALGQIATPTIVTGGV